ncbi:MAG: FAD-dependent oxidoreductase [Pseudomonadota bacterium]
MKVAVIGGGISGMAAAHFLAERHDVHLYEAGPRLGGHTATMDVEYQGECQAIDTGFIVFNDRTYPHFIALLEKLGVNSRPTEMSFSVSAKAKDFEYAGTNLNTLFGQRSNLFSGRFLRMVREIIRFNKHVEQHLDARPELSSMQLGEYLRQYGYTREFATHYLLPMGAAIWSCSVGNMEMMPLPFFVKFFRNHGLLDISNRPQWYVIDGGSRNYIGPLTAAYKQNIYLNTPVTAVKRVRDTGLARGVDVHSTRGCERFDHVVIASHSDQALSLLADASMTERQVLGAIPSTRNEVVVHTDIKLLPRRRRCWSSWNVILGADADALPALTYNMNILQGLESSHTWCVTLNQTAMIDPDKIVGTYHYDHPLFSMAGIDAQRNWTTINGNDGVWFCGAWWRNGFHEDGVWSALRVADGINTQADLQTLEAA